MIFNWYFWFFFPVGIFWIRINGFTMFIFYCIDKFTFDRKALYLSLLLLLLLIPEIFTIFYIDIEFILKILISIELCDMLCGFKLKNSIIEKIRVDWNTDFQFSILIVPWFSCVCVCVHGLLLFVCHFKFQMKNKK